MIDRSLTFAFRVVLGAFLVLGFAGILIFLWSPSAVEV